MKYNLVARSLGIVCMMWGFFLTNFTINTVSAGLTTLTGTACDDQVTVTQYDINFWTFAPTDVYTTFKINAGVKVWAFATPSNGQNDIYIIATNLCQSDLGWNVSIMADYMTSAIQGNPHIPNSNLFFSGVDTVFLFNWTPPNNTVTIGQNSYSSTTDLSDWRTILSKSAVNNGLAWYYGRLFTHSIKIDIAQPIGYYTGSFFVNCNGC